MTAMTNAQNVQNKAAENIMLQLVNEWDTQHFVRFFKQRTGMTPKSIGMWDNKNYLSFPPLMSGLNICFSIFLMSSSLIIVF